jgi:hypothetical protein
MIIELLRDRKKFIFSMAWVKLSQVYSIGKARGLSRISGIGLKEFTNTKKNGMK